MTVSIRADGASAYTTHDYLPEILITKVSLSGREFILRKRMMESMKQPGIKMKMIPNSSQWWCQLSPIFMPDDEEMYYPVRHTSLQCIG